MSRASEELLACAVHYASPRASRPLVRPTAAPIPRRCLVLPRHQGGPRHGHGQCRTCVLVRAARGPGGAVRRDARLLHRRGAMLDRRGTMLDRRGTMFDRRGTMLDE